MRTSRPFALFLALLSSALPLSAHDHWVAPSSFRALPGERIDLHLCVGCPSKFEEQIRDSRHFTRFDWIGASGTKLAPGVDGKSPAALFRPRDPGLNVIVFESDHSFVEIEPAKYAEYLKIEGLENIQAEREQRGETAKPGRDSFQRFDKTFVRVGDAEPTGFDKALGLPIELVPETDPFTWTSGELVLRLELDGKPHAGQQVKLMHLAAPFKILLARTDEQGRARFTPDESGGWVASTVYQHRAQPEQKLEGDWEGLWASLTFELGDAPASAPAVSAAPH